jgi:polyisoprenoid-binding protein YceI
MSAPTTIRPPSRHSEHDGPDKGSPRRRPRWQWVVLAVTLPLLLAGFGLWWFVLRGDTPPPVNLDQALAGLESTDSGSTATTQATAAAASTVQGTWTIDSTITNAQGTGTFAGFRIDEQLVGVGATTAVGRSPSVEGTLTVSGTSLRAAEITVDLTDITSNDSRREDAIQRALGTSRYPDATFVLTKPVDIGSVPAEGERINVKATGDLTIHGVTRSVTIDLQAQLQGGVLVVVGTAPVTLADYGVTAPTAPIVASVEDSGTIEFQLYFKKS